MKNKMIRYGIPAGYVLILAVLQWYYCFYTARSKLLFFSIFTEILAILSCSALAEGFRRIIRYCRIKQNGIQKYAVIKGYRVLHYRLKNYHFILKYQDREHCTHRVESDASIVCMRRKYHVGKKLRIAYLPDDSEHPIIIPLSFFDVIPATVFVGVIAVWTLSGSFLLVLPS